MTVAVESTGVILSPRRTYQAGAATMARGICVVQGADDNTVVAAAAANADCIGVQEEDTVYAGDALSVIREGEAVCVIGAPVSAGQFCKVDANGRLVPSTGAGDKVVAKAICSGVAAGDYIVALVGRFDIAPSIVWSAAPAHPNSAGAAGAIAYAAGFFYVCVAANTWLRFAPDATFA